MSTKFAFAAASLVSLFACAPDSGEIADLTDETEGRELSTDTVYVVTRQDFRKCASPMCGGVFVKAVNKTKTKCFDGTNQEDCYVGEIDVANTGATGDEAVTVRSHLTAGTFLASGSIALLQGGIGKLVVQKAYEPASSTAATGTFYLVQPSGITCVQAPCPSLRTNKLNGTAQRNITDLDFTQLGISAEAQSELVTTAFQNNLIVAGTIKKVGSKVTLNGKQAFTTWEPAPALTLCMNDSACGANSHCDFSVCHSNCPEGQFCPAVCWGACADGAAEPAQNSCEARCGGQSADKSCFCDDLCEDYGDCCTDFASSCP
jgi:hypothetical protein